ncbi:hypothetical protein [Leptolyngbya iicbica]|uniref:Uncharacterized protein n=1 Tax=Lyngbya confervoides BDU141951 TaxID=1574623 RepID=A0A8T6QIY2_9CYAN|nr:hypothetical protein [Leptolyngbya sp. LK]
MAQQGDFRLPRSPFPEGIKLSRLIPNLILAGDEYPSEWAIDASPTAAT